MSTEIRNWNPNGVSQEAVSYEKPPENPPGPVDAQIIEAMIEMGGGFVKALGLMAKNSDPDNLAKIKATWPQYWEDYKEHAKFNWRTLHDTI